MIDSINAIVLAGHSGDSKNFQGRNKNFLEIAGIPLLVRVLNALGQVERIDQIIVVGPAEEINELLRNSAGGSDTEIVVLEQKSTAYDNFWESFLYTLGDSYSPGLEDVNSEIENQPVLIVGADSPLLCAQEVDEFLDGCVAGGWDFGVGMTEEKFLKKFYPTTDKPGIEMTYLHLSEGSYRLNNLHFARPFKVRNRSYVAQIYEARYQKKPLNVLKIGFDIFRTEGLGLRPVSVYLLLQICVLLRWLDLPRCLSYVRRHLTRKKITDIACILLQTNIAIVETTVGRSAIDVDSEADFETIDNRYAEFAADQDD